VERALAWYHLHGVQVERVMTDNGSAYRSTVHALACQRLGLRHLRTRPYRPRTDARAERFIQTALRESAYAPLPRQQRTKPGATRLAHLLQLPPTHGSLNHTTPGARLNELNDVPGNYN
jgi:transposase InsO family protein